MRDARMQRYARELRCSSTDAERRLWYFLRRRNLLGHRFRRQVPVGPYVVDFLCIDARLVVELDGGQHAEQKFYDAARSDYLVALDLRVLRFWNNEVLQSTSSVLEVIAAELKRRSPQEPPP